MESASVLDSIIIEDLHNHHLIEDKHLTVETLAGGVSSDVLLIESGGEAFVLKRALPKLRVKDPWYADVRRNQTEYDCLRFLEYILPESVPKILHHNPQLNYFCMEYLGSEYSNYKTMLLSGNQQPTTVRRAAYILAVLHQRSWRNDQVAETFETTDQFWSLRLDPYLVTAARRNPAIEKELTHEADRIAATRVALVQGDFSPKNILVGEHRLVILDCEAAWYGDPAFDIAFFLNHFMLKAIHLLQWFNGFLSLAEEAWKFYHQTLGAARANGIDERAGRLLPMLMLARVDGKSTVEYLCDETKRTLIRNFAHQQILDCRHGLLDCIQDWRTVLQLQAKKTSHEDPVC
jgi:aminoglycoside phosphotransferase (APT) family kinase protein